MKSRRQMLLKYLLGIRLVTELTGTDKENIRQI